MASDPTYKYCDPIEGRARAYKCKFCGHIIGGGGIIRVKNHLANVDKSRNVKFCDKVRPKVKLEMQNLLHGNLQKKKQRQSLGESIRADLRKSLGGSRDSDEDVDEEQELRRVMKRSREAQAAEQWRKEREGPGGSSGTPEIRRSATTAPSLYQSENARQRRVDEAQPGMKKRLAKAIGRFFIHSQVAANKTLDHHFLNMIHVSGEVGK